MWPFLSAPLAAEGLQECADRIGVGCESRADLLRRRFAITMGCAIAVLEHVEPESVVFDPAELESALPSPSR